MFERHFVWAPWSRSAASVWRRRSTASCCARPASSVAVWASDGRPGSSRPGRSRTCRNIAASEGALVVTSPPSVVVVTGVSRFIGARVAARLAADPRVERVIGLDPFEPPAALNELLADVEWIRADARAASGALADLG